MSTNSVNIIKEICDSSSSLPTLPGIALKILDEIKQERMNLKSLADILATDPPLSAKVLKLINSSYFALPIKITSVFHAVSLLGTDIVKNLALSFSLVKAFSRNGHRFDYPLFWKNSLTSAISTKTMANKVLPSMAEDAFFLGLLHDIGILALAYSVPEQYQEVLTRKPSQQSALIETETQVLGFSHAYVGEQLVKSWGLPEHFVLPIRYHHEPEKLVSTSEEIDQLTKLLHLSSLMTDFLHSSNKRLHLGLLEWYAQEYGFFGSDELSQLVQQIHEQTLTVFPLFEVRLGREKDVVAMLETARNELADGGEILSGAGFGARAMGPPATLAPEKEQVPQIMIVDDEERNLKLLKAMLMGEDYGLHTFDSGMEALAAVEGLKPDLILLDVMMPDVDGYQVCQTLKQNDATRNIPVVIVTALKEKDNRIKAMEVGADDFLNKPVDRTELLVRVKSLLRIKAYHDQLIRSYKEIASKNKKLEELEKTKEGLTHMIIHDLRNPLAAISGNIELSLMGKKPKAQEPVEPEALKRCLVYCSELEKLIQSLLDIHRMEEGKLTISKQATPAKALVEETLAQFAAQVQDKQLRLQYRATPNMPQIQLDRSLIKRVLGNLVQNAIRHTPAGGAIIVSAHYDEDQRKVRFGVRDSGDGIAPEFHQIIFNKFEQAALKRAGVKVGSSGLGLPFCKMAVRAHGGRIWVESSGTGQGSRFNFDLPV